METILNKSKGPRSKAKGTKGGKPVHNRARRERGSVTVAILDPAGLASSIRRVVDAEYGGSVRKAALAIGLSQPTLHRLARNQVEDRLLKMMGYGQGRMTIGSANLRKLNKLFRQDDNLDQFFLAPAGWAALSAYGDWMLFRGGIALVDSTRESAVPNSRLAGVWTRRSAEFFRLLDRTEIAAPHIFIEMARDLVVQPRMARALALIVRALQERVADPQGRTENAGGISTERRLLAIQRVFEPLLEAKLTGWVERRGDELSAEEFRRFVEAGWTREKILLDREPDLTRAQTAFPV